MIQATIVITVRYAHDADMAEAVDDKQEFEAEIKERFFRSVGEEKDLHIDYAITEIS